MQEKKQQLEMNMEQWTGSKLGNAVHCQSACLTYMQSTSCEMLGWMNNKLEPQLQEEILMTADMQMIPTGRKWRGTKEPLDEGERGDWKSWIKTQHSKQ